MAYRYLNNVLKHQRNYDDIVQYLKDGEKPRSRSITQDLLNDFKLEHGVLVYKPKNLTVVPPDDIQNVIKREYQDLSRSAGLGPPMLYSRIRDTYVGISRQKVADFLKKQPAYQLTRQPHKVVNKPVLAKRPAERFMMDLVDLNPLARSNSNYRYIMNVVDVFSRYLMSRPLKTKTAEEVLKALKSMIHEEGVVPHLLQSDQGMEFRGVVSDYCKEEDIQQIYSKSYSPQTSGLVEGINKIMREKLSDAMVRNQSRRWVDYLQQCVRSWNESKHAGQSYTPEFLFHRDEEDATEERKQALEVLEKRAEKALKRHKAKVYEVGDVVRVAISAVSTKARKLIKERRGKNLIVKFTPELYRIKTVIKPQPEKVDGQTRQLPETMTRRLSNLQYTLVDLDGEPLRTERLITDRADRRRREGRFFASELQLVVRKGEPIPEDAQLPFKLASRLNRLDDGGRLRPAAEAFGGGRTRNKPTIDKPIQEKKKTPRRRRVVHQEPDSDEEGDEPYNDHGDNYNYDYDDYQHEPEPEPEPEPPRRTPAPPRIRAVAPVAPKVSRELKRLEEAIIKDPLSAKRIRKPRVIFDL